MSKIQPGPLSGAGAATAGRPSTFVPRRSVRAVDDPFADARDQAELSVRVLDVFQYFREVRRAARAIEISRALGLPHSSVDRMLKALVRRGYLSFNFVDKQYAPTYRIVSTVADIAQTFHGGNRLRKIMDDLHAASGQTVCLCVQNDCWVQNLATVPGANYQPAVHGEGMRTTILGSAPGNALMAPKPDGEIVDIARRARDRGYLELDARGIGALMEEVACVRRSGYAASRGYSIPGAVAIAVAALPTPEMGPVAVVLIADNPSGNKDQERDLGWLLRDRVASQVPVLT